MITWTHRVPRPIVHHEAGQARPGRNLASLTAMVQTPTIVLRELAARVGGASALASTGVFCQVSELPDRSVWLLATLALNEFTASGSATSSKRCPVLITGRTRFEFGYKHTRRD